LSVEKLQEILQEASRLLSVEKLQEILHEAAINKKLLSSERQQAFMFSKTNLWP